MAKKVTVCCLSFMMICLLMACSKAKAEASDVMPPYDLAFLGSIEDNTYTNSFFGFELTIPDALYEDGLASLIEELTATEIVESLEMGAAIPVLGIKPDKELFVVFITCLFNQSLRLYSQEAYAESIQTVFLSEASKQDSSPDICIKEIEFAGKKVFAVDCITKGNDSELHDCHVLLKYGKCVLDINIVAVGEDGLKNATNYFSFIENSSIGNNYTFNESFAYYYSDGNASDMK